MKTLILLAFLCVLMTSFIGVSSQEYPAWDEAKEVEVVKTIYNNVKYPFSQQIIASQSIPPGFAADISGRVDPVGEFDGAQDSLEYFYGLTGSPPPLQTANGLIIYDINFDYIKAKDNIVSFQVDLYGKPYNESLPDAFTLYLNFTQFGYFSFGHDGLVHGFEIVFRNLGLQLDAQQSTAAARATIIYSLCQLSSAICVGPLKQYDSVDQCVQILGYQKPFGTWYQADQDSVVCRQIHLRLTPIRPDIHCPHIGPSGGGKCVNRGLSNYTNTFFNTN